MAGCMVIGIQMSGAFPTTSPKNPSRATPMIVNDTRSIII